MNSLVLALVWRSPENNFRPEKTEVAPFFARPACSLPLCTSSPSTQFSKTDSASPDFPTYCKRVSKMCFIPRHRLEPISIGILENCGLASCPFVSTDALMLIHVRKYAMGTRIPFVNKNRSQWFKDLTP